MRSLILAPFAEASLDMLKRSMDITHEPWTETRRIYAPEELAIRINTEGYQILIIEADFAFAELFEQTTDLRLLGVCRNSLHQVDLDAATTYGVPVIYTPNRNAEAVAEFTIALMLSLTRSLSQASNFVTSGQWTNPIEPYSLFQGRELAGHTLGLIGLGTIGAKVSRLGHALGMRILAYDPFVGPIDGKRVHAQLSSLTYLLNESDYVSLHIPVTAQTTGLLNSANLSEVKKGAFLINTANSILVEEEALIRFLQNGTLAGAALDVHQAHPISPSNPLLRLPNVILTPHIAGSTHETVSRYSQTILQDIQRFISGVKPYHLANNLVWGSRAQ